MRKNTQVYEREVHRRILLAVHAKTTALMQKELPPHWLPWSYSRAVNERVDGPLWSARDWFGPETTQAEAKSCQRAVIDLEDAKLLDVTHRMRNLKLTADGLVIVRRLKRRARSEAKALAVLRSRPVTPRTSSAQIETNDSASDEN